MKYELEFEINDLPKTYNALGRSHWSIKLAESRKWHKHVLLSVNGKLPKDPLVKAKLTLTRFSSRCPDSDGLVSSFKGLVDGLVKARVLIDDSYDIIGMPTYSWSKAEKNKGKVRCRVESVD